MTEHAPTYRNTRTSEVVYGGPPPDSPDTFERVYVLTAAELANEIARAQERTRAILAAHGMHMPPDPRGGQVARQSITVNTDPSPRLVDPCAAGHHRWAWLTDGGQACGYCGQPR